MPSQTEVHDYQLVSGYYDALAALWSFGNIARSRNTVINRIKTHSTVLIFGPGTCRGFEELWTGSCQVTMVDSSPEMLMESSQILKNIPPEKLDLHTKSIRTFQTTKSFQSIWLPYFLNVFRTEEVVQLLRDLKSSLKTDGEIYITDFMGPDQRWTFRFLQEIWHGIPMAFFHLVTGNSWHSIHPLPDLISRAGYEITEVCPVKFGPQSHRWIGTYVCKPVVKSS